MPPWIGRRIPVLSVLIKLLRLTRFWLPSANRLCWQSSVKWQLLNGWTVWQQSLEGKRVQSQSAVEAKKPQIMASLVNMLDPAPSPSQGRTGIPIGVTQGLTLRDTPPPRYPDLNFVHESGADLAWSLSETLSSALALAFSLLLMLVPSVTGSTWHDSDLHDEASHGHDSPLCWRDKLSRHHAGVMLCHASRHCCVSCITLT